MDRSLIGLQAGLAGAVDTHFYVFDQVREGVLHWPGVRISLWVGAAGQFGIAPAADDQVVKQKEKEKGNIKLLPAGETTTFHLQVGLLSPDAAQETEKKIGRILS